MSPSRPSAWSPLNGWSRETSPVIIAKVERRGPRKYRTEFHRPALGFSFYGHEWAETRPLVRSAQSLPAAQKAMVDMARSYGLAGRPKWIKPWALATWFLAMILPEGGADDE